MGKVRCTKGVAMGQGFQLPEDRKVIVGKNPQKANLVINDPSVSGVHCSIRYQAANNTYSIIDHSTNGTYVNGVRLQKDVPMQYPAGTVLTLANENNEITLG
jgi:pSer/pThr/pTyr-binding forkhead associated (FHA) protein